MAKHPFSDEEGRARFGRAVATVEACSCAEVVVAVRPRSAPYGARVWASGAALGYGALLFTLFAPPIVGPGWIALIVAASCGLGVGLASIGPVLRALIGTSLPDAAVASAARATFVELRVDATRERSGILIYVSLLEQRASVVADVGVLARVDPDVWAGAQRRLETSVASGVDEPGRQRFIEAIEALGPILQGPLPRAEDDTDELEDVA
ncbi:MAG: hypothetical protein AAF721_32175 [Myxococcota bacterium]